MYAIIDDNHTAEDWEKLLDETERIIATPRKQWPQGAQRAYDTAMATPPSTAYLAEQAYRRAMANPPKYINQAAMTISDAAAKATFANPKAKE